MTILFLMSLVQLVLFLEAFVEQALVARPKINSSMVPYISNCLERWEAGAPATSWHSNTITSCCLGAQNISEDHLACAG